MYLYFIKKLWRKNDMGGVNVWLQNFTLVIKQGRELGHHGAKYGKQTTKGREMWYLHT